MVSLTNNDVNGLTLFMNGVSYSSDGPSNSATLRNNIGTLRLQGNGSGYNTSEGATLLSGGNIGINNVSPSFSFDVVGGIHATSNGNASYSEGYFNSTITTYSPNGITAYASIWMGFDPVNDCGFINCARLNAIRPINIQARTDSGVTGNPYVGIGATYTPAYCLDVQGSGNITTSLTSGSNRINCASLRINGTNFYTTQWSGVAGTTISYNNNVTVTGTVTATTYSNLPVATTSVAGIINPVSPSLNASSGLLSVTLSCFSGIINGSNSTYYTYSIDYAKGFSLGNSNKNIITANAGYYVVYLMGIDNSSTTNTIIISGSTTYKCYTAGDNKNFTINLGGIMHLNTNDVVTITNSNNTAGSLNVVIRWLAPY
jgi:hypothetical protein